MKNILIGLLLVGAVAVTAIYFFRKEKTTNEPPQNRFEGTWRIDSLYSNDLVTAMLYKEDSTTYQLKEHGDSLFIHNMMQRDETDTFTIVAREKLEKRNKRLITIVYTDSVTLTLLTGDSTFVQYKKVK